METTSNVAGRANWIRTITIGRNPRFTAIRIIILVAVVFVLRAYVLLPIKVAGPSMLPTYSETGLNFINRLAYIRSEPQRGDVVAIRFSGTSVMLMKRIVALPGESVGFRDGQLLINGEPMDEPYLQLRSDWTLPSETLADGEYYVVGDNRSMPESLHQKGRAGRERIVGRILLCNNLFESWL